MTDNNHHSINYVEFPSLDLAATKSFYGQVFGWEFQDWGDTYVSFQGAGIDGGFDASEARKPIETSGAGALVILYSDDLAATETNIVAAGGSISVPAFEFPGGRRFHFLDPSGNELAVWTKS